MSFYDGIYAEIGKRLSETVCPVLKLIFAQYGIKAAAVSQQI
jgi:hypothetical protein